MPILVSEDDYEEEEEEELNAEEAEALRKALTWWPEKSERRRCHELRAKTWPAACPCHGGVSSCDYRPLVPPCPSLLYIRRRKVSEVAYRCLAQVRAFGSVWQTACAGSSRRSDKG